MTGADNMHALTGAYALDALAPAEAAAFERHLAGCEDCRSEVDTLRAAAARLGGAHAASPPPELRARVLEEVARTRQAHPGATADRPARPGSGRRHPWLVAAAAAAVVVALAAGGLALGRERAARAEAAQMATAVHVLAAPDAVTLDVALGTAHVVASVDMGAAVLMGTDVPAPESGVYQVWMMHADGSPAPGPTFVPEDGEVMAVVEGDLAQVTELAVTVEPEDGDGEMSAQVVATVEL